MSASSTARQSYTGPKVAHGRFNLSDILDEKRTAADANALYHCLLVSEKAFYGSFIGMVASMPAISFGGRWEFHYRGIKSLLVEWVEQENLSNVRVLVRSLG